jgi:hypothetical protein
MSTRHINKSNNTPHINWSTQCHHQQIETAHSTNTSTPTTPVNINIVTNASTPHHNVNTVFNAAKQIPNPRHAFPPSMQFWHSMCWRWCADVNVVTCYVLITLCWWHCVDELWWCESVLLCSVLLMCWCVVTFVLQIQEHQPPEWRSRMYDSVCQLIIWRSCCWPKQQGMTMRGDSDGGGDSFETVRVAEIPKVRAREQRRMRQCRSLTRIVMV